MRDRITVRHKGKHEQKLQGEKVSGLRAIRNQNTDVLFTQCRTTLTLQRLVLFPAAAQSLVSECLHVSATHLSCGTIIRGVYTSRITTVGLHSTENKRYPMLQYVWGQLFYSLTF